MPKCVKHQKKKQGVCIGSMRDRVELLDRDIQSNNSDVDFTEEFSNSIIVSAMVNTRSGLNQFDGVNRTDGPTHIITIRFLAGVTAETYVRFKGKLYDILETINLDERDRFLELRCSERGSQTIKTNTLDAL